MKHLFLLVVAIVLFGITTKALACNYERMSHIPNYSTINKPKLTLNIPNAYAICVAPNGDFAVTSWNTAGKIYLYSACGRLMKVVNTKQNGNQGYRYAGGCAFTNHRLYVTDVNGRKVHEYSPSGKFIRYIANGLQAFRITACQNRLYITTYTKGQYVFVYNMANGKEIRRISVPAHRPRVAIVGLDGNLHVSTELEKQVYTYTPEGKRVGVTTYKEIRHADGLAMDIAGNILIADHLNGEVEVYSLCGALIKTIRTGTRSTADVKIGNDGTIMVSDYEISKVFLY